MGKATETKIRIQGWSLPYGDRANWSQETMAYPHLLLILLDPELRSSHELRTVLHL